MFSLTSSPKPGGAAPSRLFNSARGHGSIPAEFFRLAYLAIGMSVWLGLVNIAMSEPAGPEITRAAANQCSAKLKTIEAFAAHRQAGQQQTTRFSEDEVNSYLALDLSKKYHPSLKSLTVTFEEDDRLQSVATIDFDRLGKTSTKFLSKLLSFMLSGVHTLTARGQIVSGKGKAHFQLEQARFDNSTLPRSLVEEIITAVGRKQNPPFDPLQPSDLFDGIQKVDVHKGYIVVYQ